MNEYNNNVRILPNLQFRCSLGQR